MSDKYNSLSDMEERKMPVIARQRIQSLDRGLQILEYIANHDGPVRLVELAQLIGIEKSSACRLVLTLADRGYVRQDPETTGYLLDEKVFELAGRLASQRRIQDHVRKYLRHLAQETGETSHLAVRGKGGVVFVDHEFGSQPVAVTSQWGSSEPFHCTALGKALLAGVTEEELKDILGTKSLKQYTPRTVTRLADLAKECRKAREELVAMDDEEYRPGVRCLAAPVFDFRGQVIAAIGISGPLERLTDDTVNAFKQTVKTCARELSFELGHRSDESRV